MLVSRPMAGVLAGLYLISKNRNSKPKVDIANGIQLVYLKDVCR